MSNKKSPLSIDESQPVPVPEVTLPWDRASRAAPLTHKFHEECLALAAVGLDTNDENVRATLRHAFMAGAYSAGAMVSGGISGMTPKAKMFTMGVALEALLDEAHFVLDTPLFPSDPTDPTPCPGCPECTKEAPDEEYSALAQVEEADLEEGDVFSMTSGSPVSKPAIKAFRKAMKAQGRRK